MKGTVDKLLNFMKLSDDEEYDEEYEEYEDDEEEEEHKVVRVKRFAIKPMDVEEAVLQMELLGHSFYVFENAEDGEVNVLYQRKDGNYGLIEPER